MTTGERATSATSASSTTCKRIGRDADRYDGNDHRDSAQYKIFHGVGSLLVRPQSTKALKLTSIRRRRK
jgi:hypothetical protein